MYKYRNITTENLNECFNLQNLIENQATISSRTCFGDKNDSRFIIIKPNFNEFLKLEKYLKGEKLREYRQWKNGNGGFSRIANKQMKHLGNELDKIIDTYGIYCTTDKPTNKHMWKIYADNHTGFCIEFNSDLFEPKEVKYERDIPSLDLTNMIKKYFNISELDDTYGMELHEKLFIKSEKWIDENEYRYVMSGHIKNSNRLLKKYKPENVNAIIFGHNMRTDVKQYIIERTNFNFSQAIFTDNNLDIVKFDKKKHLK